MWVHVGLWKKRAHLTHPVSEIVTVCLNPRCLVSLLCCHEVSREVAFVLIAISIRYCGVRIPL